MVSIPPRPRERVPKRYWIQLGQPSIIVEVVDRKALLDRLKYRSLQEAYDAGWVQVYIKEAGDMLAIVDGIPTSVIEKAEDILSLVEKYYGALDPDKVISVMVPSGGSEAIVYRVPIKLFHSNGLDSLFKGTDFMAMPARRPSDSGSGQVRSYKRRQHR